MKTEEMEYMKKRGYQMNIRSDIPLCCEKCGHLDNSKIYPVCSKVKESVSIIEFVKLIKQ